MNKYFVFLFFFLSNIFVYGQSEEILKKDAINIFLSGNITDLDYLKQEINFINYVRDTKDADVSVMITRRTAANGGSEYSIIYEGLKKFKAKNDTLTFFTNSDATNDEIRQKQINFLKIGLIQYISHSPMINDIKIDYTKNLENVVPVDKWNSWVFDLSCSLYSSLESTYKHYNLQSNASANRITEKWKIKFNSSYSFNNSVYIFPDDTITSPTKSYSFYNLMAKSIGKHWAIGEKIQLGKSTYSNKQIFTSFLPTIEYNIFPYSKSNIIQWRFQYSIGPNYFKYIDTTIFNKTEEFIFSQSLNTGFDIKKKWGSTSISIGYSSFLPDLSKNKISIGVDLDVRIFAGFSIFIYGSYQIIHDQIYLPKLDLSYEEILLRQQQTSTNYSFWTMFGFSYTFGSIYNNVVNPRFNDF